MEYIDEEEIVGLGDLREKYILMAVDLHKKYGFTYEFLLGGQLSPELAERLKEVENDN